MGKKRTIGVAAAEAGVNIETIRYYQRIGMIDEPKKPPSGFRIYPQATISRIRFIQRAQELGFSLAETRLLLELDDGNCARTRELAEQKLTLIQKKIDDLNNMARVLNRHINACKNNTDTGCCPLIASLNSDPEG